MKKIFFIVLGALCFFGGVNAADAISAEGDGASEEGRGSTTIVAAKTDKPTVSFKTTTRKRKVMAPLDSESDEEATPKKDTPKKGTPKKATPKRVTPEKATPETKTPKGRVSIKRATSTSVATPAKAEEEKETSSVPTKGKIIAEFSRKTWNKFMGLPGVRHVELGAKKFVALPGVSHARNYTAQSKGWLENQASAHPYLTLMVGGVLVHVGVHAAVGGLAMAGIAKVVPAAWLVGVSQALASFPGNLAFVKFW